MLIFLPSSGKVSLLIPSLILHRMLCLLRSDLTPVLRRPAVDVAAETVLSMMSLCDGFVSAIYFTGASHFSFPFGVCAVPAAGLSLSASHGCLNGNVTLPR
jgi:hypothetical protein